MLCTLHTGDAECHKHKLWSPDRSAALTQTNLSEVRPRQREWGCALCPNVLAVHAQASATAAAALDHLPAAGPEGASGMPPLTAPLLAPEAAAPANGLGAAPVPAPDAASPAAAPSDAQAPATDAAAPHAAPVPSPDAAAPAEAPLPAPAAGTTAATALAEGPAPSDADALMSVELADAPAPAQADAEAPAAAPVAGAR